MYKIAISGKANSGKNTLAKMIQKECKIPFEMVAFADPIKKIAKIMFPNIDNKHLFGSSKYRNSIISDALDENKNPLTVRQLLKDIGTKLGRSYKDTIWLDRFDETCAEFDPSQSIILMDCRFLNEFNHLKNKNYYLIRIKRDNDIVDTHVSESAQDAILDSQFDYVIDNNGSKKDLLNEVKKIVKYLKT